MSDIDDVMVLGLAAVAAAKSILKSRGKKRARMDPYLRKRPVSGRYIKEFNDLVKSLKKFKENFRMDPETFEVLFSLLEPHLKQKKCTRREHSITPKEKLAAVLEYLASGSLQRHIASVYRISKQHFGVILEQVCDAIIKSLAMEIPLFTEDGLLNASNRFNYKWNFPNCVGAIDGKHVQIKRPNNAGTLFYNYKGFHSVNLMAVADANYKFSYIDVGAFGSEGGASVFNSCTLGKALAEKKIKFPQNIAVGDEVLPFYFVADDAFPLGERIMKPFVPKKSQCLQDDERIFNYRLSRARRCVENAFGILCSRWFCLARIMHCSPQRAQKIITACCYLHNFLMGSNNIYCPSGYGDFLDEQGELVAGQWRQHIPESSLYNNNIRLRCGRPNNNSKEIRNAIKNYVNSNRGSLPWQRRACNLEE